jgi:formylglycine-generating enzyme required for sulfatase activity
MKTPNAFGLYDMTGNAYEWVSDQFNGLGYGAGPNVDPGSTLGDGGDVCRRGGGFNLWPSSMTNSYRLQAPPWQRGPSLGFRLVRSLP